MVCSVTSFSSHSLNICLTWWLNSRMRIIVSCIIAARRVVSTVVVLVILLSRVVVRLGTVAHINPKVIEELFAADLAYLQALYNRINQVDGRRMRVTCPQCQTHFDAEPDTPGES